MEVGSTEGGSMDDEGEMAKAIRGAAEAHKRKIGRKMSMTEVQHERDPNSTRHTRVLGTTQR